MPQRQVIEREGRTGVDRGEAALVRGIQHSAVVMDRNVRARVFELQSQSKLEASVIVAGPLLGISLTISVHEHTSWRGLASRPVQRLRSRLRANKSVTDYWPISKLTGGNKQTASATGS